MAVTRLSRGSGLAASHLCKDNDMLQSKEVLQQAALQPQLAAQQREAPPPGCVTSWPCAKDAARSSAATVPRASHAALGATLFGVLAYLAGAAPWALPHAFLLFAATALPWRVWHYAVGVPRNAFFLLDFCYAVNAATAAYLLLPARLQSPGLEAAVYALADGPVAGAILAWQISWTFHSAEHTVSLLLHLLPGLAMAARHHLPGGHSPAAASSAGAAWLLGGPLAFYAAWQALYFLAVQVAARRHIIRQGRDTSYRCLARRAARAGNLWARLVLRGSTARRLAVYGALQLAFTVATLLLFVPTHYSGTLAWGWQAAKFVVPVYYGCVHQAERVYKAAVADGVRRHLSQVQLQVDARGPTAAPLAAAISAAG